MKIKIRSGKVRFSMPVPTGMAVMAIKAIPDAVFENMREKTNDAFAPYISREIFVFIYEECRDVLEQYKGLEIIHVEGNDGTFVSVKL